MPDNHNKVSEELTPEEVRRCADSVAWGECITFPNGLVVDKRVIPAPSIPWTPQQPTITPGHPTTYPYPPNMMGVAGSLSKMVDPYEAGRQERTSGGG